jgi:hypothetical protein
MAAKTVIGAVRASNKIPGNGNLSAAQFGKGNPIAGLYANMTAAGYTAHSAGGAQSKVSGNTAPAGMGAQQVFQNRLKQHMMSSAGSSGSLGAALNETGGSMFGDPVSSGVAKTAKTMKKTRRVGRLFGRGKSQHEGMNAKHLANSVN